MSLLLALASLSPAPAEPLAPSPTPVLLAAQDADDEAWTGSVNVGGTFTSGNSETSTFSVSADAERRVGDNRYAGKAAYNYTTDRAKDSTSQDNRSLDLEYNRFVDERLYLLGNAGYLADEIKKLDARTTLGVGAGYQIEDTETFDWTAEAGVSFVDEDFAVDAADADYAAGRLATGIGWVINEQVDYAQDVTFLQSLDESDDQIVTNDSRVNVSLSESMIASLQYVLDYDNTPVPGADRDDHRFIVTVGWTF